MVATIIPMVHGNRKTHKIPILLLLHSLGSLAGGAVVGGSLTFITSSLWRPSGRLSWLAVNSIVGVTAVACSLRELELIRFTLPQSQWIVPRRWAGAKSEVAAVSLYGFSLGTGVFTRIHGCLYAVIIWMLLAGSVWRGLLVMAIFGVCRTLPLWLMYSTATTDESDDLLLYTYVVSHWQSAAWMLSALSLAIVGGIFVGHAH
jgi:cytochrome c biogenesis protein CcdA